MKKYIPDFITSLNLVCGLAGLVFAFKGRSDIAFPLMIAASVFDFCDGLAARALDQYSDLGKELDSLCDLVSFGVLPSVMMYSTMKACMFGESWICWIPLVMAVFAAIRLAKFNVDPRQLSGFLGLPTPAAALLSGALCHFIAVSPYSFLSDWAAGPVFLPLLALVLSALMVCELPMFSLKIHRDDPALLRNKRLAMGVLVAASAVVCVVFKLSLSLAFVISLTAYIIKNILYAIFKLNED